MTKNGDITIPNTPINLFVYGTLRDWDGLARFYFRASDHATAKPATMPGKLYTTGAFPAMVAAPFGDEDLHYGDLGPDSEPGDVVGLVITVRPPFDDLRDLVRMECGAGYYVDSRLAKLANGDLVRCQVFLYEDRDIRPSWPRLPGDDFARQGELDPESLPTYGRIVKGNS